MRIRFILPALAALLLQSIAVRDCDAELPESAGQKSAVQNFFETLYPEWFRLHSAAAHRRTVLRADIVFAPKLGVVTLERGGNEPSTTIALPQGMTWHAFQFSVHGVRKLSFPVILQRPNHHEPRSPQDDEEILIIGDARKSQLYFQIGSRTTGVTGGGSGGGWGISKRNRYTVSMPANRDARFRSNVSMLDARAIRNHPMERVESGDLCVQVLREPAQ